VAALEKDQEKCDEKEMFIRDCFDWFFYYVDQIQHHIDRRLIEFEDVGHVFKPYAKKLAPDRAVHEAFMEYHHYDLAQKFWASYAAYNNGVTIQDSKAARNAAG
jgi:hypothetical protein